MKIQRMRGRRGYLDKTDIQIVHLESKDVDLQPAYYGLGQLNEKRKPEKQGPRCSPGGRSSVGSRCRSWPMVLGNGLGLRTKARIGPLGIAEGAVQVTERSQNRNRQGRPQPIPRTRRAADEVEKTVALRERTRVSA